MSDLLEIHIPISPTPNFFNRIHYLAASLHVHGRDLSQSRLIVTVGADREPADLQSLLPWSRQFPIDWHWMDRRLFRDDSYYATALDRFRRPFSARNVMMLDADTIFRGDLIDLIAKIEQDGCFYGMPALGSPWHQCWEERSDRDWWQAVFNAASLGPVPYVSQYSCWGVIWGKETDRFCPPYFNLGVLIAPASSMTRLGSVIFQNMRYVEQVKDFIYKCQIALTLSIVQIGLDYRPLPMRYNMPNHPLIASHFSAEAADSRILHYLAADNAYFQKDRDLENPQTVARWLNASPPVTPIDTLLRQSFEDAHAVVTKI